MRGATAFVHGFCCCYLLAAVAFGSILYASQRVEPHMAISGGLRWPVALGLLWHREAWLRADDPAG